MKALLVLASMMMIVGTASAARVHCHFNDFGENLAVDETEKSSNRHLNNVDGFQINLSRIQENKTELIVTNLATREKATQEIFVTSRKTTNFAVSDGGGRSLKAVCNVSEN